MRAFCNHNAFKKASLHVIAHHLTDDQIQDLRNMFLAIDKNEDGTITFHEMKAGLDKMSMSESAESLRMTMESLDVDGNLRLAYTEFIASALDKNYYRKEDMCWEAFRAFDVDDNGTISAKELQRVLRDPAVGEAVGADSVARVLA